MIDNHMYHIKEGDHEAIVFLEKHELYGDVNTIKQIRTMIQDPSVSHPRIMPDCHYSNSCCVGFTSKVTSCTVPRYIGGDIGCGMTMFPISEDIAHKILKRPERYHDIITSVVPVGSSKRQVPVTTDLTPILDKWSGSLPELLSRIGFDNGALLKQLGTLGGGNHFMELGVADTLGTMYIAVHTGSRGLGQAVCKYHQDIITQGTKKDWKSYEQDSRQLLKKIKRDKSLDKSEKDAAALALDAELRAKYLDSTHEKYLTGDEAAKYFHDMAFAQEYARYNRYLIIRSVLEAFGMDPPDQGDDRFIESIHNYIDFEDQVWRKGAIRADRDQLIIIALNMRDGILLARGKGNENWNNSAPHGAGRKVPRNQARHHSNMKEFTAHMKDVFSRSVRPETLDESPVMYKSMDIVSKYATDTCEIVDHVVPIINVKGWD